MRFNLKQTSFSLLILLFASLTFVSCKEKTKKIKLDIPMEVDLYRFDKAFAEAGPSDLEQLKSDFPMFFDPSLEDSFWYEKMKDTLQIELQTEVLKQFSDITPIKEDVKSVFQYAKHYFPQFEAPVVYTSTTDVAFETKVIYNPPFMVVGLDNYLGSDHHFYEGIQLFFTQNMNIERLPVDVALELAMHFIAPPTDRTFLSQILAYGKLLYFAEHFVPEASEQLIMGYTDEQWAWTEENEVDVWRYFIENETLYDTQASLRQQFIDEAPFSKFYLEIDHESPGRIGQYMGWKIIQAYMRNNDAKLQELALLDAETIFINSKYKPKKR